MKSRTLFVMFAVAALMLACNMPGSTAGQPSSAATAAIGLPATATGSAGVVATDTVSAGPTDTVAAAVTDTPSAPTVTPIKDAVNCRFGPAGTYESVGAGLAVGASAQVLGRNTDSSWLQIPTSSGTDKCWVAASVVTTTGDLSQLPVVAPPATFVTNLMLVVKPASVNLGGGCGGPKPKFSFTGTIYVNGPTMVTWYFETQEGGKMSNHTSNFGMFGFTNVTADYTSPSPKKGTYWVRLYITSPNSMMMEASYQIKCS